MSVLVIFEAKVSPGGLDEVERVFAEVLPETRTKDGGESVALYTGQDEPAGIMLVERWASREHHEAYAAWRRSEGDPHGLAKLLIEPSTRYLSETSA
jgi:quinol monooxygenase YgiN